MYSVTPFDVLIGSIITSTSHCAHLGMLLCINEVPLVSSQRTKLPKKRDGKHDNGFLTY